MRHCFADIEWGDTLLDIGTGPTIQSILSASRRLGYIDLGDFSPKVLQILRDWHGGSKQIQQEHLKYEMSLVSDKYDYMFSRFEQLKCIYK